MTAVVSPIPSPFIAEVVTASVGHIPSISTKVGFPLIIPLYRRSTGEFVFILVTSFQILECRHRPVFTPFKIAFVVIVAPLQRINLLITCCTGFCIPNFSTFLPLNWL